MSRATMTRRGFLKSTAAMGAVTALGISAADSLTAVDPAHADEASDVKIIKTSCRACIASCAVLAHVRDGRVVKIEGNPESPMSQGGVCAKGLAGIQALYHPNRNKYPMRRVGCLLYTACVKLGLCLFPHGECHLGMGRHLPVSSP